MDEAGQVIRAKYAVATDGATTKQGGAVTAGKSGAQLEGRNVARVGDEVTYPDGSKAWITMGFLRWKLRMVGRDRQRPTVTVNARLATPATSKASTSISTSSMTNTAVRCTV